jgi:radical SAM protein with 4Fe4S-binding SPASM domain
MKKELGLIANRIGLENLSEYSRFPKYFEVETIRACNARCSMCTIYEWDNKNNRMEDSLFSKILDEIQGYGSWIDRFCLSRNGEPLLDKGIVDKVRSLKKIGIRNVSFSTNASLLDEKLSKELIEAGLDDIRFSIDGAKKETFEKIRRGLNFEKVVYNCQRFLELRNEMGEKPLVQIRMTLQEENAHEEEALYKFWSERIGENDIIAAKPMHNWGNQLKEYRSEFDGDNEAEKYKMTPCVSLWSTMIIHFDGKVPLCGCDYNNKILLGDVNNSSINAIWNSERFNELRDKHSEGKRYEINLCNSCNIWDIERKIVYPPIKT